MTLQHFLLPFLFITTTIVQAQKAITLPDWKVEPQELHIVNSPYRDVNISITPNGKYLYFMSGRGSMPWSSPRYTFYNGKPEYDGDIWYSRKEANGEWGAPVCVGAPICTASGEDEPNISADGQTVYFQSWSLGWQSYGGPYYRAELHGDKWGRPVGLSGGINRFFREGHTATDGMSISPDGKTFVVACGDNYEGPMDIYISRKDERGAWSYLQKLSISTPEDDRSVFIGADNKTLYFGSAGWGGFGKLDIFKTTIEEGVKCGAVYNIGKPFNTAEEDYGFVMDVVRNDVYFVRNSDIFYAHLGEQVADSRIQADPVVVIDGTVKDDKGQGIEATISVLDSQNKPIAQARSNAITGEYSLSMPRKEGSYKQEIRLNDKQTLEKTITIDAQTKALVEQPIVVEPEKPVPLPVKKEEPLPVVKTAAETVIQKTIYFDFDKTTLTAESNAVLLELAEMTKNAKSYFCQITGHTDNWGTNAYNQVLSEKRTKKASNFLTEQGIVADVMTTASKGETEPVVSNDSSTNRAKNRRVDIIFVLKP